MQLNVQYTLVPDSYPNLPLTGLPYPSDPPPNVTNSICSAQYLDSATTRQRYIMTVKTLIGEVRNPHALTQACLTALGHAYMCDSGRLADWRRAMYTFRALMQPSLMRTCCMQGFYVNMDYHNIAPDAVMDNYTVRSIYCRCNGSYQWSLSLKSMRHQLAI